MLDVIRVNGDIHAVGNRGTIIVTSHDAGKVTIEPATEPESAAVAAAPLGFFGTVMRFTCCAHDFTTLIKGAANCTLRTPLSIEPSNQDANNAVY